MAWIFYFVMIGNQWLAQGFVYDLSNGTFYNPTTNERRAVGMFPAAQRSGQGSGQTSQATVRR